MTDDAMHDHNLDLIMALAEGALDDDARTAAEAQIAACAGCEVELAAQRLAIDALNAAAAPELTELEAVRMRRALRAELGIAEAVPLAPADRRRGMRWQRFSVGLSAAAVLLLVVAIVPALDLFGVGDNDAIREDVALAPATAEIVPETAVGGGSADDFATRPVAPMADLVTTTVGADPTTLQSQGAQAASWFAFGSSPDLKAIRDASLEGYRDAGDVRNLLGYDVGDLDMTATDDRVEACIALGGSADVDAVPLGTGVVLGEEVFVVAYIPADADEITIVAHAVEGCAIVATAP